MVLALIGEAYRDPGYLGTGLSFDPSGDGLF
jgi:hypothetical protein